MVVGLVLPERLSSSTQTREATVEPRLHMKKAVEADELARFVKANEERTLRAAVAHVRQAGCRTAVP